MVAVTTLSTDSMTGSGLATVQVASDIGWVCATMTDDRVVSVGIVADRPAARAAQGALAARVEAALAAYFSDRLWPHDLPIRVAGTAFQQRVWHSLRAIPPGSTRTYGDIARELGSGARAVGNACRANPLLLLVPCHRVVAAHGRGGFAGHTQGRWPGIKEWLLQHEAGGP